MKARRRLRARDGWLFETLIAAWLLLLLVVFLVPLWKVLMVSLSPEPPLDSPTLGLLIAPWKWRLDAYLQFLGHSSFLRAATNSLGILAGGVATGLLMTVPLAYVLSIPGLPGRKLLSGLVLVPFLFNPGLIPNYLTVTSLGLTDRLAAVFLPGAVSVYNTFVMKSFFQELPAELKESARMDGASELAILLRIVLPLSVPILLTIGLFYGVHFWNDFFSALLYLSDHDRQPLPILLRNILIAANMSEYVEYDAYSSASVASLKAASVLITALPMLLAYPWIQKYFTKGTLVGSIKG